MSMAWIFRVLFFFEMAIFFVQSTDWVDNVTRYIAEESGAREVMFITKLAKDEKIESPIIEEVILKLMQKLPILTVNINEDDNNANGTVDGRTSWDPSPVATSAAIYLLVHVSRETPPTLPSSGLIDAVAEMASYDYRPKFLVLFSARALSDGLDDVLQYAWTQKLLDLTILEWSEPESASTLKPQKAAVGLPIVHQLNPFKNEYTRSDWALNTGLFPDKTGDMAHYPLRISAVDNAPLSIAKFDALGEPVAVGGAAILLIQLIAERLNASLKYIPFHWVALSGSDLADPERFIDRTEEIAQMDISSQLVPRLSTSRTNNLLTVPIRIDGYCALVPILPEPGKLDIVRFFWAIFVSLSIVTIYLIAVNLLRFRVSVWRPFSIVRALFGVSVSQQPRTNAERIVFASLLAISAVYSSHIYTAITNVALLTTSEKEFESFNDLDDSGLTLLINPLAVERVFANAEGVLRNLKNKSKMTKENMLICAKRIAQQKNITCLTGKFKAEMAVIRSRVDGRTTIKIANPCFWTDGVGFRLGKRSPYRSTIDTLINRMLNSGLIQKLFEDAKYELTEHNDSNDDSELKAKENMITLRRHLVAILVVGYTMSLLTFMAEILIHRLSKSMKNVKNKAKKRPVVLFPYTE